MQHHTHTHRFVAFALLVAAVIAAASAYGFYAYHKTQDQGRIDAARQRMGAFSEFDVVTVRVNAWGNDVPGIQMTDETRVLLGELAAAYNADPSTSPKVDPSKLERAYYEDALETFGGDPSRDAALALWLWMARPADLVYVRDTYDDGGHILEVSGADANSEGAYSNIEFCRAKMDGLSDSMNMRFRWEDQ